MGGGGGGRDLSIKYRVVFSIVCFGSFVRVVAVVRRLFVRSGSFGFVRVDRSGFCSGRPFVDRVVISRAYSYT